MASWESSPVQIFWDNSNIFVSAKRVAERKEGACATHQVRVHFENLLQLASAGRHVEKAVCVGSVPPDLGKLWKRIEETGTQVSLLERGADSGKEQGVDENLQSHMLRVGYDYPEPGVIVLLTGDGRGFDDGVGFHSDLERLHRIGWGVEVISWRLSCANKLREWAQGLSHGVFVDLEKYYESVTFLEKNRRAAPLSLRSRHCTVPQAPTR